MLGTGSKMAKGAASKLTVERDLRGVYMGLRADKGKQQLRSSSPLFALK